MAHNPRRRSEESSLETTASEETRWRAGGEVPRVPSTEPRHLTLDQRQLQHLLNVVVAISADMDMRAVLRHLVKAATDLVGARYGALDVLGEGDDFVDLIAVGVDDAQLRATCGLPRRHGLLGSMLADRQPLRVEDVSRDPRSVGFPPQHPVMKTLLGVPLMVRGTVYGNLYLADKKDGTPFGDDDEVLLTALANAAGIGIGNAHLYERLRHTAEHFQRSMLPILPDLRPVEVQARYQPASELLRLGGDWYDALVLPDGATCVVIGDVTGHDVEAASLMGQMRNMLRALAYDQGGPPSVVVSKFDAALTMFDNPTAATLVLGLLEKGGEDGYVFRWSNAGHPPPLLIGVDGRIRYLAPARHGIPVGIDPSVPRFDHTHPLVPGSTLLMFTDGLVERRDQDIDDGLRALADHVSRLAQEPLHVLCDEVMAWRGQTFDDDVALLAVRLPDASGG